MGEVVGVAGMEDFDSQGFGLRRLGAAAGNLALSIHLPSRVHEKYFDSQG